MKHLFLTLLIICFSLSLSAQKIHFTDTSNVWKELQPEYNDINPWLLIYSTYSFIANSTIDSVEYRHFNFGYVREDTILKKVYIREGDSDKLLMDYNLNVGDTFTTTYTKFVVAKIDSTLVNSVWYRVWYFPPIIGGIYGSGTLYVIEGIGCIQDPTYMLRDFSGCVECSQPSMYCFSNNGITPPLSPPVSFLDNDTSCATFPTLFTTQLQSNHHKISIFPNPATASLTIISPNTITTLTISNLIGQTVYANNYNADQVQVDVSYMPAGVYFVKVNGSEVRKFVKE